MLPSFTHLKSRFQNAAARVLNPAGQAAVDLGYFLQRSGGIGGSGDNRRVEDVWPENGEHETYWRGDVRIIRDDEKTYIQRPRVNGNILSLEVTGVSYGHVREMMDILVKNRFLYDYINLCHQLQNIYGMAKKHATLTGQEIWLMELASRNDENGERLGSKPIFTHRAPSPKHEPRLPGWSP